MIRIITIASLSFFLSACKQAHDASASFYYWKIIFQFTADEKETLEQNGVTKLYVRYFDVVLRDGKPVPLSSITFKESPGSMSVVPVVYIKNEVMLHAALDVDDLAKKVLSFIDQINRNHSLETHEIQLDCDWTLTSRESYFRFIDHLKKHSGKTISATIRLHQVKHHPKTGVPPVDKGVLMYYNMGRISADSVNSIYDRTTARRYISSLKNYPLTLAIALPIFSWGIHTRNNTVVGLLSKVDGSAFNHDEHFEEQSAYSFVVKENVIKMGRYFEQNDRIKIESIRVEDLKEMISDLSDAMIQKPQEVIFYDLDTKNLRRYSHDQHFFKKIGRNF